MILVDRLRTCPSESVAKSVSRAKVEGSSGLHAVTYSRHQNWDEYKTRNFFEELCFVYMRAFL